MLDDTTSETTTSRRERLMRAQLAIAALIVHDNLPFHRTFLLIEKTLANLEDDVTTETIKKARQLLSANEEQPADEQPETSPIEADEQPKTPPIEMVPGKELVSEKEACRLLGLNSRALSNNRANHKRTGAPLKIPYLKVEGKILYRVRDLQAFQQENPGGSLKMFGRSLPRSKPSRKVKASSSMSCMEPATTRSLVNSMASDK